MVTASKPGATRHAVRPLPSQPATRTRDATTHPTALPPMRREAPLIQAGRDSPPERTKQRRRRGSRVASNWESGCLPERAAEPAPRQKRNPSVPRPEGGGGNGTAGLVRQQVRRRHLADRLRAGSARIRGQPRVASRASAARVRGVSPTSARARRDPRGLAGLAYWYGLWPIHRLIFAGMLRGIARAAEGGQRVS
jgi:hypothetical protein